MSVLSYQAVESRRLRCAPALDHYPSVRAWRTRRRVAYSHRAGAVIDTSAVRSMAKELCMWSAISEAIVVDVEILDERKRMVRSVPIACLCCLLLWVSTACAPTHTALLSEHGYRVSLHISDTLIWMGFPRPNFPEAAVLVVRVRDAQGQPVDGIPVRFSVEPSWTQNASFTPAEMLTRNGEAQTSFQANTTGVVQVMARVDNVTCESTITISTKPSPGNGGS